MKDIVWRNLVWVVMTLDRKAYPVHSIYNSEGEAKKICDRLNQQESALYVVTGLPLH